MITDTEIQECGWEPITILIEKDWIDEVPKDAVSAAEDDIYIQGWNLSVDDNLWYEMYRNSRRLTIVKKWYRNQVGQQWEVILDIPISDKKELLQEMNWVGIKTSKDE